MEDSEVLLENDPLAIYLKNINLLDYERIQVDNKKQDDKRIQTFQNCNSNEFQNYIACILKSELLFEDDYGVLQAYHTNNINDHSKIFMHRIIPSSIAAFGLGVLKYSFPCKKLTTAFCFLPLAWNVYKLVNKILKRRKILLLLEQLNVFTNLARKCLRLVGEIFITINYYSPATMNNLPLYNIHTRFAKELYSILLIATNLLITNNYEITAFVPLSNDNNIPYDVKEDFLQKTDIKVTDLKLLFEFYLLVQSDFLKVLGLTFCHNLWQFSNCNIDRVTSVIIPRMATIVGDKIKLLRYEYAAVKNFGVNDCNNVVRKLRIFKQSRLYYIDTCVYNTELHFQQLLCKARHIQNTIVKLDGCENISETSELFVILTEMENQVDASKHMLDAAFKHLNHIINKDANNVNVLEPQKVITKETEKPTDLQSDPVVQKNEVYELYIPKEGFSIPEEKEQRPVFSIKELDYTAVLMDELKAILKGRNPDIFEEESQNISDSSDSEEDQRYTRFSGQDIFRPQQPTGLAENLLNIGNVLAAHKNMFQKEECFEDDFED